jgi:hypothetical protein
MLFPLSRNHVSRAGCVPVVGLIANESDFSALIEAGLDGGCAWTALSRESVSPLLEDFLVYPKELPDEECSQLLNLRSKGRSVASEQTVMLSPHSTDAVIARYMIFTAHV